VACQSPGPSSRSGACQNQPTGEENSAQAVRHRQRMLDSQLGDE
jgi:hypothetical protein